MAGTPRFTRCFLVAWLVRLTVGSVFILNISCAATFILQPDLYMSGFEVAGLPGRTVVQALGITFLMWNVPYLPLILKPETQISLYVVVLIQQMIGLAGETWLWWSLPGGHTNLSATGLRFMAFDGLGLALMAVPFGLLVRRRKC